MLRCEFKYTEGVMKELDMLIIGGYFVENKRYSEIGSVLLGVADTLKNEGLYFRLDHSKCDHQIIF